MRKLALLFALAFAFSTLVGCQKHTGESIDSDKPLIVTTTTMITDLAKVLSAGRLQIRGILQAGQDPHVYNVRPSDARLIKKANLVLFNGLHLESTLEDVIEENLSKGVKAVALAQVEDIKPLQSQDEQQAGAPDPHIWMSVPLWKIVAKRCTQALIEFDPSGKEVYEKTLAEYSKQLDELDGYIRKRINEVQPPESRVLITSHDAFQYLGKEYHITVEGATGISTEQQATTRQREKLIRLIKERKVKAIFVETSTNQGLNNLIRFVAKRTGAKVGDPLYSDSLGEVDGKGGTYLKMMRHNIDTIVDALTRGDDKGEKKTP